MQPRTKLLVTARSMYATHHVVRGPDWLQGFPPVEVARRERAQIARPQLNLHHFELPHHLGAPLAQGRTA